MKSEEAKPAKGKKKIIIVIVILLAIVVGAVVSFGFTSGKETEIIKGFSEKEVVESTVPLEEFLINLDSGESAKKNFLKIELSLYSTKEGADVLLNANVAEIRDTIISVLRKKSVNNVFVEEEGKLIIKKELIEAINKKLDTDAVEDIFITNIVTQ
ncbi:MAG: flagellar basal body-associated FliL family protein [Carnobacterium jeotgali]|uniref:flagellar basal body-associated FliL family protein n=1 Tax=Carnobacterium jeotgali TaxID=545534 RepID=UPI003C751539